MEHFRRLGFAEEIRALGMPADYPTDIAYFTRYAGHELTRFALPSAAEARKRIADARRLVERSGAAPPRVAEVRRAGAAPPRRGPARHRGPLRLAADGVRGERGRRRGRDRGRGRAARARRCARYLVGADGGRRRSGRRARLPLRRREPGGARASWAGGCMRSICAHRLLRRDRAEARLDARDLQPGAARLHVRGGRQGRIRLPHPAARQGETDASMDDAERARPVPRGDRQAGGGGGAVPRRLDRRPCPGGRALPGRPRADRRRRRPPVHARRRPRLQHGGRRRGEPGLEARRGPEGRAPAALLESYEAERRPLAIRNTGYAAASPIPLACLPPRRRSTSRRPRASRARRRRRAISPSTRG